MNFSWAQVIAKLLIRHNKSRIVDREAEVARKFLKLAQAMHVSQPDQPHWGWADQQASVGLHHWMGRQNFI